MKPVYGIGGCQIPKMDREHISHREMYIVVVAVIVVGNIGCQRNAM